MNAHVMEEMSHVKYVHECHKEVDMMGHIIHTMTNELNIQLIFQ